MGVADVVTVLSEVPTLLKLKKGMVPRPASVADCIGARGRSQCQNLWASHSNPF